MSSAQFDACVDVVYAFVWNVQTIKPRVLVFYQMLSWHAGEIEIAGLGNTAVRWRKVAQKILLLRTIHSETRTTRSLAPLTRTLVGEVVLAAQTRCATSCSW
jgi:hypothetical protein